MVEPTPASIANLERALQVVSHFSIPFSIVINKSGISEKYENEISIKFKEKLVATIPYDEEIPHLLANGIPPINGKGKAARALKEMVKKMENSILSGRFNEI